MLPEVLCYWVCFIKKLHDDESQLQNPEANTPPFCILSKSSPLCHFDDLLRWQLFSGTFARRLSDERESSICAPTSKLLSTSLFPCFLLFDGSNILVSAIDSARSEGATNCGSVVLYFLPLPIRLKPKIVD